MVTAAAIVGLGTADLVQHYRLAVVSSLGLSVARVLPLVVGRRRPVPAWWLSLGMVTLTAAFAQPVSASEPWPWIVTSALSHGAVLFVLATTVTRTPLLLASWMATMGTGVGLLAIAPDRGRWEGLIVAGFVFAAALIAGDAVGGRREVTRRLNAETAVSDAERTRRVLLEERARIARDLHDVVGHHMSLIVVQAESAPYRLGGNVPEDVATEFTQIAEVARESLEESRRLLAVLRRDPAARGSLHPQPRLADLDDLVDQTRRAGTVVDLDVTVSGDPLPHSMELAVYRLAQEALSNVVRHAPGASARVEVAERGAGLVVSITNTPSEGDRPAPPSAGHGLLGMRERAALLGGSLDAGATPTGGWRVAAVIPLPAAPSAAHHEGEP